MAKLADILARAVLPVFGRLRVSQEQLLSGPITHTQLTWQVPPIVTDLYIGGVPLWEYCDVGVRVNESDFVDFHIAVMQSLRNNPKKVINEGGYKVSKLLPRTTSGERFLWLSMPEGGLTNMYEYAGAIFSMECAQLLKQGGCVKELVETENDFYAITQGGVEVGVKAGLPIYGAADWDTDCSGLVPELLRLPRGDAFTGCDYDLISKLRSSLWEHREKVAEFDAADTIMQMLRVLADGSSLPELQKGVLRLRSDTNKFTAKSQAYEAALNTLSAPGLSDRQKINMLKNTLYPLCMSKAAFTKAVFPFTREPPPMLFAWQMEKLIANVTELSKLNADKI